MWWLIDGSYCGIFVEDLAARRKGWDGSLEGDILGLVTPCHWSWTLFLIGSAPDSEASLLGDGVTHRQSVWWLSCGIMMIKGIVRDMVAHLGAVVAHWQCTIPWWCISRFECCIPGLGHYQLGDSCSCQISRVQQLGEVFLPGWVANWDNPHCSVSCSQFSQATEKITVNENKVPNIWFKKSYIIVRNFRCLSL